ncbi:uncharacterized protein LOC134328490 [Trichomycterus rosablanca]|uniref:uncharacterized protein LOC134328490 n=1 Tax=Trichomycterus rosablanca TaxID=2290929 RepID=UPI002F3571C1
MMMFLRMLRSASLIVLLMISGICDAQYGWWVTYTSNYICALKGSTVIMGCTYEYPSSYTVQTPFWSKGKVPPGEDPPHLASDPEYSGIQVDGPETVKEGTAVTLTCKTTCTLTDNPSITWYRNQHKKQTTYTDTSDLHLQPARMEDGGRYQCSVGDHLSSAVTLNVGYPPKSVSVSVSPPGVIMEGSSVTLTCSSDAKPAASYQWYKEKDLKASGETLTIHKIRSDDGGEYKCRVWNEHGGQESSIIDIDVHYPPKNVSVSVSPSGEIMENSSVTLTCSSDAKPAASYYWYKGKDHKASEQKFIIPEIRSDDGGEYKCRVWNEHGYQDSTAVNIDVHYPPRNVSVSVSPSGVITEGSSVTLTCSSDAKPAASYHWFKGTSYKATGETFIIHKIRSDDGGEYKCRARNEHGGQDSSIVDIDVHYPPKNVSVSVSPSGVIMENKSVTLTCSSDAKPAAWYHWYKGTTNKASGQTFTIPEIRSDDGGEYKCRVWNEHGDQNSTAVNIDVHYPPRHVSVSVSPSGEITEGSSVTLTCSSDAKPAAWYHWFKGTSYKATGEIFTIHKIRSDDGGEYKCRVWNEHGDQNSTAVNIDVHWTPGAALYAAGGVIAGCLLAIIIIIVLIRRKKRADQANDADLNQAGHHNADLSLTFIIFARVLTKVSQHVASFLDVGEPVQHRGRDRYSSGSAGTEEAQYAAIKPRRDRRAEESQQEENQYDNVRFTRRSPTSTEEDLSVIYSSDAVMMMFLRMLRSASLIVLLMITGLQVEVPETVKEGAAVTLTCKTTCSLPNNATFTWYRNQQELQTTTTYHYYPYYYTELYLQPVRMEDGGRYQCAVGDHRSSAVTLNVGYPPKNVSVSVSPSGVIMEGSSVNLTCSSDAKPAASYQWFKETTNKATGETFTIHKIRSDDGEEYKCLGWNKHGYQNSTAVNIDVHYPPRSVSVSVSPSGEITEGSLVTLTCSAVSNPPVENYTWYKEQTYKGSGETLTVRNISSEDGGEYKCRTSYKNQFKSSDPVAVKVLYPPKRVSVWVSSSAEPDQSGLVNLTCSADADPPVESYVWYKEGGSSAVGSGQSYGARPGESYYCRAQNKLGQQTGAALFVTLNGGTPGAALYAAGGVIAGCLLAIIIIIVLIRRKKRADQANDADLNQAGHHNADLSLTFIIFARVRGTEARFARARGTEEAQYAAIKPRRDGRAEQSQQEENQYDNVRFTHRSPTSTEEDLSVIYSSDAVMMMFLRMLRSASLIVLLMISVVDAQYRWGVTYTPKSICALNGSTVILSCTYKYPRDYTVQTVFWSKELVAHGVEPPDLASDPEYRGRVQYIGEKNDCTLKLSDVTEKDQRRYYFRFITDQPGGKYQGADGVELHITGLQVEVPETVKEGAAVTLRCKSTCTLTYTPSFTWYRNQQQLQTTTTYHYYFYSYYYTDLHLQSVRMEDGGRYQCAVGDHRSSAVTLNVEYPPKNVSVSVSPSGEIMEESSVTLTCSSDAKPAASYQWFKGTSYKTSGETFTIHKIRSDDGGEYKCQAWNEHGDQNSTAFVLPLDPPRNVSVSVSPSGEITEGSSVTLTCSAVSNPPVENYTWYKEQTYKGSGETLTVRNISSEDGGEYKCRTSYKNQFKSSGPVAVKVLYPPKRVSVWVSSSAEPDPSGLVNLTCSADADPPVESYIWYKEGGSSAVGSGQSYGARPGESYYCRAQNKLGTQTAAARFVTSIGTPGAALYAAGGVIAGCLLAIIIIIVLIRSGQSRRCLGRAFHKDGAAMEINQENLYSTVAATGAENDRADPEESSQDEVQYVTIVHRSRNDPAKASGSAGTEEAQYAAIKPRRDRRAEQSQQEENQYDNVRFTRRSPTSTEEDLSVIYSSDAVMMMFLRMLRSASLIVLLMISGVCDAQAGWELLEDGEEHPDLASDPEYRGRVQYGDNNNCTLKLSNVTEIDQRKYYFRFITDQPGGKYQGAGGVQLHVTGLQVEGPVKVTEGAAVTLRYPSKNISVSVSPSGEIMEGSSVTLTCSSDAKPAASYHWYKGTSYKESGETFTIHKIRSDDGGEYKCRAWNKHGYQYSTAVNIDVHYPPRSVSVSVIPSGEITEGSSVTLTCSADADPPVENYTWYKEGGSSAVGSGQSYGARPGESYYCRAQNKLGEQTAAALFVTLNGVSVYSVGPASSHA